jgi:hypothetical protein
MSKIYKLREWLTVPEAAKQLSISFGEEVTEADILRLALEKHLRLSVYFVNKATARVGKYVSWEETEWILFPKLKSPLFSKKRNEFKSEPIRDAADENEMGEKLLPCPLKLQALIDETPIDERENYLPVIRSLRVGDDRFISLSDEVNNIEGVWDLPLFGAESLDVEHKFQNITGGPGVTLIAIDGAFVERNDGRVFQLQEDYDENEYQAGSKAELKLLKQYIINKQLSESEADELLKKHAEDRKEFLERRKNTPKEDHYYPAGGLPEDAVFVVRRESIRDFEQFVNDDQKEVEKLLSTSERNSLLTIIAALCQQARIQPQERGAPTKIANLTEAIGAPVSDDTVRRLLAKLPDALESRMK